MHPNKAFRRIEADRNLAFAARRGFGTLAVNGAAAPILAHLPFALDTDTRRVELHLLRSNPIAVQAETGLPATLAVQGPDGYVSPDWYGFADQVPTWNYVAVHLRGRLERLPAEALRGVLDRISDAFEDRLAPKPPWRTGKMPADLMDRMMRSLVPFALSIEEVDATWKLNQNKDPAARLAAAGHMARDGIGFETAELARLMRDPD